MRTNILISFLLLFLPISIFSQNNQEYESPNIRVDPEWLVSNRVVGFNWAFDVIADEDGNTYRTGYFKRALNVGENDITPENSSLGDIYFLIKSNSKGQIIWYSYAIGNSRPCRLNFDKDGNIYTVGSVFSKEMDFKSSKHEERKLDKPYDYNSGMFICKYDTSGKILKTKFVSEGKSEFPHDFKIDNENNIYIGGHYIYRSYDQPSHQKRSYLLLKLDSDWEKVWQKCGDSIGTSNIASVFLDQSDKILASGGFTGQIRINGCNYTGHQYDTRPFVTKHTHDGTLEWVVDSFENVGSGFANSLVCDQNDNIYIWIGTSYSRFYFVGLNKKGKQKWMLTTQARMTNYLEKALIDDEGNVYLCGQGYGAHFQTRKGSRFSYKTEGSTDVFIVKYSKKGELLWLKVGGGKATDYCKSIALSGDYLYAFGWSDHDFRFKEKEADEYGSKCFWMAKFKLKDLEKIDWGNQQ
jgi:hypothetical protein